MRRLSALALLAGLLSGSCSRQTKPIDVEKLLQDFIGADLAMSPVTATQMGFHDYEGVNLDSILDDFSERGMRGYRIFFNSMHVNADRLDSAKLDREVRADFELIRQYCEDQLLEIDTIQSYRHNPTMYVELIGQAINGPFTLEYAPLEKRYEQLIARLTKIPGFLDTAKANLTDSPEIRTTVAQQENEGNIDLIDRDVRSRAPAGLKAKYDAAAGQAIEALKNFNAWMKSSLKPGKTDWRLGRDVYNRKFRLELASGQSPEDTLQAARQKLESIRGGMREEAQKLWPKYFRGRRIPAETNAIVRPVLDRIAQEQTIPEKFFAAAKEDYQRATAFVREKQLLELPPLDNLQVIPTPVFMRGVYGVAGFQSAPPLEPKLGAFFWITPFEAGMPKADVESKLREYNRYGLATVVIHEAMPGHFVQQQIANEIEPRSRAVLRQILGNQSYIEGWAVYATELMVDEGFEESPEMRLTFDKQMLRVVANTILDIELQTAGMTDQEALALMMDQTFQERQEAVAKLQRAKLTSCQLPTYFAGWQAWERLRDGWKARHEGGGQLPAFHAAALKEGALPLPVVASLLH